jgi:hypothetical protein
LRLRAALLCLGALLVLAVTSVGMSQLTDQVRAVGSQAAPQAVTASDLYFALSDLDAQVARLIMLGDADTMSSNRLDALRSYQQRSAEVDADLARAVTGATDPADRARVNQLIDGLALYRQWTWQALGVQAQQLDQTPGRPPATTLGYYAQATTVLHGQLLPTAKALRQSSQDSLARAYAGERRTAWWAGGLTVLSGGALIVALVLFQVRLTRRYRRLVNLPLLLATLCVAGLVVAACVVFHDETGRLESAQRQDFAPYLSLTQAQAISYDTAGDSSRYLISPDPGVVEADVKAKSHCLVTGGSCQPGGDQPGGDQLAGDNLAGGLATLAGGTAGPAVLDRWNAYQRDHEQIVALADAGQLSSAVGVLTGISRGDAAFDFYYYDAAISRLTAQRQAAFDGALADARGELAAWPAIPPILMVVAALLVLLGVRPRLAEYR